MNRLATTVPRPPQQLAAQITRQFRILDYGRRGLCQLFTVGVGQSVSYSALRAATLSTRVARSAGTKLAVAAARHSAMVVTM